MTGWLTVRKAAERAGLSPEAMAGLLLGYAPLLELRGPEGKPLFSDVDRFLVRERDVDRVLADGAARMMSSCRVCSDTGSVTVEDMNGPPYSVLCPSCRPDRGSAWR